MRGAIVPLVGTGHAVVHELVADRSPGLAPVIGSLHRLTEPSAALRGIDAVRLGGGPLRVVNLPPGEVGAADAPAVALAVGGKDECPLSGADQNPDRAHGSSLIRRALSGPGKLPGAGVDVTLRFMPEDSITTSPIGKGSPCAPLTCSLCSHSWPSRPRRSPRSGCDPFSRGRASG